MFADRLNGASSCGRLIVDEFSLSGADAAAEAVDCTILRPNGEYLPPVDIDEITMSAVVFARAKPEDKLESMCLYCWLVR